MESVDVEIVDMEVLNGKCCCGSVDVEMLMQTY